MDQGAARTIALQLVVDSLPDRVSVLRLDGDDLVFVAVNDLVLEAYGVRREDLLGRSLDEVQPARVVAPATELVERALAEHATVRQEIDLEGRDGRHVLDVTVVPLPTDGEVLTVTHDLTATRRTAAALAETQAIARIGHWAWDMEDDRISWTEELYRVFGVDPETWDATYASYRELVHPDDRAEVDATIRAAIDGPSDTYTVQHRVIRPDGSTRVVHSTGRIVTDSSGEPVRLAGTAQDITERIAAEEEALRLREAHARHEQGLELNDNVMQGLAVTRLALMEGDHDRALASLDSTMESAREIIRSLLEARFDDGGGLQPGDLVRTRGALQGTPGG